MSRIERRGDYQVVVGDDLQRAFHRHLARKLGCAVDRLDPERVSRLTRFFVEWLCTTGDGSVALQRINDAPKQLFLPFPDDERPWRESEDAGSG